MRGLEAIDHFDRWRSRHDAVDACSNIVGVLSRELHAFITIPGHDDIEAGRYLLMVDASKAQRPLVKELMNVDFPHVPYRGGTSTRLNVFERPKTMHHQTTH